MSASEKGMLPQGTPYGCACLAAPDVRGTSVSTRDTFGVARTVVKRRPANWTMSALCS
ncbi:MAG: hypothetical protein LUE16_12315 [Lachnospiraceae bacterium]|nr:hypothetical protein [Lachnospiraceae bacterium]